MRREKHKGEAKPIAALMLIIMLLALIVAIIANRDKLAEFIEESWPSFHHNDKPIDVGLSRKIVKQISQRVKLTIQELHLYGNSIELSRITSIIASHSKLRTLFSTRDKTISSKMETFYEDDIRKANIICVNIHSEIHVVIENSIVINPTLTEQMKPATSNIDEDQYRKSSTEIPEFFICSNFEDRDEDGAIRWPGEFMGIKKEFSVHTDSLIRLVGLLRDKKGMNAHTLLFGPNNAKIIESKKMYIYLEKCLYHADYHVDSLYKYGGAGLWEAIWCFNDHGEWSSKFIITE
jgi:hypothetical protein